MLGETYWELMRNIDHWLFELTLIFLFDVVIGMLAYPLFRKWLAAHDRRHHTASCGDVPMTITVPVELLNDIRYIKLAEAIEKCPDESIPHRGLPGHENCL